MPQGHQHQLPNGGVKQKTAGAEAADGPDATPTLRQVCHELQDKVEAFLAEDVDTKLLKGVQAQVKEAVGVIDEALEKYSMEELSLSYNGGKDCLVLLMLILACLPRHFDPQPSPSAPSAADPSSSTPSLTPNGLSTHAHSHAHSQPPPNTPLSATPRATTPTAEHQQQQQQQPFPATLQSVYIVSQHPFAEVDEFVAGSARTYHLDLRRYPGLPMRAALEAYLAERPALKAVFVGTRRTDPHGADLRHFDPTDEGWPRFVRVHPVIDWHYAEIWAFIRHLNIPYLSLYDKGYTSLGGTEDTHPNPHLKKDDGHDSFRPAYELIADDEERLGRDQ